MEGVLVIYFMVNIYGFVLMYVDKQRALQNKWRISEKHIWTTAVVGGALGATLGMKQFRHKTKHKKFTILLPLLTVFTLFVYGYILWNLS